MQPFTECLTKEMVDFICPPEVNPLDTQVGGTHYKEYAIQPMEYGQLNKLPPCEFSVVKYVTRWRDKGGVQDLIKARHCIDMLIQIEGLDVPTKAV